MSSNVKSLDPAVKPRGDNVSSRHFHLKKIIEKLFLLSELPQIDCWLSLEFAKNKKFGSQDRKWYSEQVFLFIRYLYFILYQCQYKNRGLEQFSADINTPKKLWSAIKNLSLEEIFPAMDFAEKLQIKNETQENVLESSNYHNKINTQNIHLLFLNSSVPLWLKPYLLRNFSELSDLEYFLNLQNKRPSLWIRLNHIEKRDDVLNDLKLNEFEVQTYQNQKMLSISGTKSVYQLDSFTKGFFEIQDYASQEIGNSFDIKPGNYVWDVCAGGGGKTMQIASSLNNKGVVYATDIREYKLEEIKRRAKRAQFFNVRTLAWDGKTLPNFPKEIQNKKGFHAVLVDAPCSASGTWRRHPDAKYKMDEQSVDKLTQLQLNILSVIPQALQVGGKLIYATCSVFREENEEVVYKFLENHSEFKLSKMTKLNSPNNDSDFMFVAVMIKIS